MLSILGPCSLICWAVGGFGVVFGANVGQCRANLEGLFVGQIFVVSAQCFGYSGPRAAM